MFSLKSDNRRKSVEVIILPSTALHRRTQTLAQFTKQSQLSYLLLLQICPCEADRNKFSCVCDDSWAPLLFSPSFLSSSSRPSSAFFPHPAIGLSRREMLQLHYQHAVDFDSCVPPSLSLCDAISDYIVITNALGACSQPPLSRTWAKLFREHCLQVWIYRSVKCFWASVAQTSSFCRKIWSQPKWGRDRGCSFFCKYNNCLLKCVWVCNYLTINVTLLLHTYFDKKKQFMGNIQVGLPFTINSPNLSASYFLGVITCSIVEMLDCKKLRWNCFFRLPAADSAVVNLQSNPQQFKHCISNNMVQVQHFPICLVIALDSFLDHCSSLV